MKNKMLIISMMIFLSILRAGDFGGYSIFEYSDDAFEINRVYLQYTDDLADDLFLKIRYDVGREGVDKDGKFVTYLKNAYVDWKSGTGGKFSFGMISTNSYGIQEATWGYRFIAKSTADYHGFTNTADLGIGYSQKFGNFSFSAQVLNGEGYKSNQSDNHMATYLRFMYGEPKLNKNDGYNVGIVMTQYDGASNTDADNANLLGLFGGWSGNNLRLGLEHNSFESWNNQTAMLETQSVQSLYANYSIFETLDIFMKHNTGEWWVENDEGNNILTSEQSVAWVGAVWSPSKGLYISPNIMIEDDGNGTIENNYRLTFMFRY